MNAIKQKELEQKYSTLIHEAKLKWSKAAGKYYKEHGDTGCCIMGDGIEVFAIPPKCRKPRWIKVISSAEVAHCQGSGHYEATKDTAVKMLEKAGLEVRYNYGMMD
jgi:hypothetical protein